MSSPIDASTGSQKAIDRLFQNAWAIVNPAARRDRHGDSIRQLAVAQDRLGYTWHIRVSMHPGQTEKLAAEAARAGAQLILVIGGDGTLHQAINGIMHIEPAKRPVIGLLPMGTGNDFAKMLGIPQGVEPALQAIAAGNIGAVDLGLANGRWFANDLGLGLVSEATSAYHKMPGYVVGSARYVAAAFRAATAKFNAGIKIWINGQVEYDGPFSLAAVSNGAWTGGRFMLNPEAEINDGVFNVCYSKPLSRVEALRTLPSLLKGKHLSHPQVESKHAMTVRIESKDLRIYQMDGELYDFPNEEGLEIQVCPEELQMLFGPYIGR